jgi:nitroimidazol reductase NimA-like FMN-containing flavoprotein (pyridoxamine 5'-phosphate oxidase superfamily)
MWTKEVIMSTTIDNAGPMDETEILKLMKDKRPGVLCLVDEGRPYAIPMGHYFKDANTIYFSSSGGVRKLKCIETNPYACFVLYDSLRQSPSLIKKQVPCRSIVIEGKISLTEPRETEIKGYGEIKTQLLKLDIEKIGNFKCPIAFGKLCNPKSMWWENHPEIVEGL